MTARLLAALALAGAAGAAVPAHAVILPACTAALTLEAAGTVARCSTDNTPMVSGATVYRTVRVAVAVGSAKATLRCGFGPNAPVVSTATVTRGEIGEVSLYEDFSPSCTVEATALSLDTTAVATSTFTYAFIQP